MSRPKGHAMVSYEGRAFYVPSAYIDEHGLIGSELFALAARYGWTPVLARQALQEQSGE